MLYAKEDVPSAPPDRLVDEATKLIAANFNQHRQQVVGSGITSHIWKWAAGVILFPEALCPRCNGVMRSNRIWQVDEREQKLVGAAKINGSSKLVRVERNVHPHVDGQASGYICLGNAKSASEALFLGLYMGNPYWRAGADWFQEVFDHECSTVSKRNSREHLTASMRLAERAAEKAVEAPAIPAAPMEERLFNGSTPLIFTAATGSSGISSD